MDNKTFDYRRIAEGYAKDRPYLHGHVMEMLKARLGPQVSFECGLDIGCGAGLSSKALHSICSKVTGADISEEMVRAAEAYCTQAGYDFICASAEEVPAEPETFDIVTAAGVINWVEEHRFLSLLNRIMKDRGILLIYDFWISDRMEGNEAYTEWFRTQYLKNFPKPLRKENMWTSQDIAPYHFEIVSQETWSAQYQMEEDAFIRFMLLQSNVIAQVEKGGRSLEEARSWFQKTLKPVFADERQSPVFDGYSWCFRLKK